MGDEQFDREQDDRPRRRWRLPFTWLGLMAIGWLVYEITAQPALGVFAVAVKFGWDDLVTARWLRKTDPNRARGRAYCWLYRPKPLFAFFALIFAGPIFALGFRDYLYRKMVATSPSEVWDESEVPLAPPDPHDSVAMS